MPRTPNRPPKPKTEAKPVEFEAFVRAAMQTGKSPKPAKNAKKRKAKK